MKEIHLKDGKMEERSKRVVYPKHNNPMSYQYRARIEKQEYNSWFGRKLVKYRAIIEQYFVCWKDWSRSGWYKDRRDAEFWAAGVLDRLDDEPKGEYL